MVSFIGANYTLNGLEKVKEVITAYLQVINKLCLQVFSSALRATRENLLTCRVAWPLATASRLGFASGNPTPSARAHHATETMRFKFRLEGRRHLPSLCLCDDQTVAASFAELEAHRFNLRFSASQQDTKAPRKDTKRQQGPVLRQASKSSRRTASLSCFFVVILCRVTRQNPKGLKAARYFARRQFSRILLIRNCVTN